MGCDGCELWPAVFAIIATLVTKLRLKFDLLQDTVQSAVTLAVGNRKTSDLYREREVVADDLVARLGLNRRARREVIDAIRHQCKCYAGLLGTFRAGHKGYADEFERPMLYPGRLAKAAKWLPPTSEEIVGKPWLCGMRRLIFISDMGDALSRSVPFPYLLQEVIENVRSTSGQQQMWLWLTKRPARMAEFGEWLAHRGISWPDNLVAMTTVTRQQFSNRVHDLQRVPSKLKGLSLEPLFEGVDLPLAGIDWVIVGGGSDVLAEPFHLEWALKLREQCQQAGAAFFLKQLGKQPFYQGKRLSLADTHGGNWHDWPKEWRTRELPRAFRAV